MKRVNEIFYSLQGEGYWMGTPAVFLRFSGCNRNCDFCDTDFEAYRKMTVDEIVEEVCAFGIEHVVLTGGEPALQADHELVSKLRARGKYLQIETNGSLPVDDGINWVTCSPKQGPWLINRVEELKVVYTGQDVEAIAEKFSWHEPVAMFLQPCYQPSEELTRKSVEATIDYVLKHPHWRLSLQVHKMLGFR